MRSDNNSRAADAIKTAYKFFRPLMGPRACRFHPTCSEYSFQSFKIYGFIKGAFLSTSRILRCHPWNQGGYDPVPLSDFSSDSDNACSALPAAKHRTCKTDTIRPDPLGHKGGADLHNRETN